MSDEFRDPFRLSESDFLQHLALISRDAVLETFEMPYGTIVDVKRDIETNPRRQMSASEAIDLVGGVLHSADPTNLPKRLSNYGESAAMEDTRIHRYVGKRLHDELNDHVDAYTTEEGTEREWRRFLSLPAGKVGVLGDPVDGTSNSRAVREAFSCNLLVYGALGGAQFDMQSGVGTNASMETMIFDLRRRTVHMISPRGTLVTMGSNVGARGRRSAGTYATVGSRAAARLEVAAILDPTASFALGPATYGGSTFYDRALTTFLTGGAPKMISWPMSELEYLHVPHDQTPYDATPLVGCLLAGSCKYYVSATKKVADLEEVVSWMNAVTGPAGAQPHPVKAGLLVRDGADPKTTSILLELAHEAHVALSHRDGQR